LNGVDGEIVRVEIVAVIAIHLQIDQAGREPDVLAGCALLNGSYATIGAMDGE
jgi:hypothetical protein